MSTTEQNRRRNQVIARRTVDKILYQETHIDYPEAKLWVEIRVALKDAMMSAIYAGQTDRAARLAHAYVSVEELWRRGQQLSLFPDDLG